MFSVHSVLKSATLPSVRDRLTKERRSWNMSRIRGKNTSPELVVRKLLHRMGYRFRLHVRIPFVERLQHGGQVCGLSK